MTDEKIEQVRRVAVEMVNEIEWVDVWRGNVEFRNVTRKMVSDPKFIAEVHQMLRDMFDLFPSRIKLLGSNQEPELEAAGIIQSVVKYTLCRMAPPVASLLRALPLTMKFTRLPVEVCQAPRGAHVSSLAEQMAGRQPGDTNWN